MEFCINEMAMQEGDILSHIREAGAQGVPCMEIGKAHLMNYLRSGGTLEEVRRILEECSVKPVCLNSGGFRQKAKNRVD